MVNISTGVAGFEPTRKGVKVLCLTAWLYPNSDLCNRLYPNSDLCNNKGLLLGEYINGNKKIKNKKVYRSTI